MTKEFYPLSGRSQPLIVSHSLLMNVIMYMNKENFSFVRVKPSQNYCIYMKERHNFITEILNIEYYGDHQEPQGWFKTSMWWLYVYQEKR